jgi:hypothetical protein
VVFTKVPPTASAARRAVVMLKPLSSNSPFSSVSARDRTVSRLLSRLVGYRFVTAGALSSWREEAEAALRLSSSLWLVRGLPSGASCLTAPAPSSCVAS